MKGIDGFACFYESLRYKSMWKVFYPAFLTLFMSHSVDHDRTISINPIRKY